MTRGKLMVITGPMFAGKTTSLIKSYNRISQDGGFPIAFKPAIDSRSHDVIKNHDGDEIFAIELKPDLERKAVDVVERAIANGQKPVGVFFDETQFFKRAIVVTIRQILEFGIDVVACGLRADFRQEPFGQMGTLLAIANNIFILEATCNKCGQPAQYTQRITDGKPSRYKEEVIVIGANDRYEARCDVCYELSGAPWYE